MYMENFETVPPKIINNTPRLQDTSNNESRDKKITTVVYDL